jgi:hypothetical protein
MRTDDKTDFIMEASISPNVLPDGFAIAVDS